MATIIKAIKRRDLVKNPVSELMEVQDEYVTFTVGEWETATQALERVQRLAPTARFFEIYIQETDPKLQERY
jgi:hypothetical protein